MPPSRAAIVTMGSRGDVQPYVALGKALRARGAVVRIITFEPFRALVETAGLEFYAVRNPIAATNASATWQHWQRAQANPANAYFRLRDILRAARGAVVDTFRQCLEGARDASVIVSSITGFCGTSIAERLGVRHCWALLQPFTPTGTFPHFLAPFGSSLGATLNRFTHAAAGLGMLELFGSVLNQWRRVDLGLPAVDNALLPTAPGATVLYGISRFVVPKPPEWGDNIHVTGYWFLDPACHWQPDARLEQFLQIGPPPLFAFVSGFAHHSEELRAYSAIMIEAARLTGQRLILLGGREPNSHSVFCVDEVPYEWLFSRVSIVFHHGGPGTIAECLRAGRPCVAVPGFFDQPYWSRQVARLGVAPAPIQQHRLTARSAAQAIETVLADRQFRDRAAELSRNIRSERGACAAAEAIGLD
jgi:sterol 3beta-glucosyltransferase